MIINFENYLKYTIIIYLVVAIVIWIQKPKLMFKNNSIKQFGTGKNKTILYYPFVIIIIGLGIYILMCWLFLSSKFMFKNNNI